MIKFYKILLITFAAMFSVSVISKNYVVKAEPVTAVVSATALSVCVSALIVELVWEIGQSIGGWVNEYEKEASENPRLSGIEVVDASDWPSVGEIKTVADAYMIPKQNELGGLNLPLDGSINPITSVISASEYYESLPDNPSAQQLAVYNSLLAVEHYSEQEKFILSSDGTISTTSNVFSQLYGDALQGSISDIYNVDTYVSYTTGLSQRQIAMKYPALPDHFPSLAVKYGARQVYRPMNINGGYTGSTFYFFPTSFHKDDTRYYVCFTVSSGLSYIYAPFSVTCPAIDSGYSCLIDFSSYNSTSGKYVVYEGYPKIDGSLFIRAGTFDSGYAYRQQCFNFSFPYSAYFEFTDLDKANAFYNEMLSFSDTTYNPSLDVPSENDDDVFVVTDGMTNIEKAVAAQQGSLGTTDDLDIVINPGLTVEEDGSTTYNPSISVGGTNLADIDFSSVLDITDITDMNMDTDFFVEKFPFSLPFDFYRVLTLFVRDPVEPIFEIPIKGEIKGFGLDEKIDESIVLDLTVFKINGVDIVQAVLRFSFLVGFVILLIKTTTKFFV